MKCFNFFFHKKSLKASVIFYSLTYLNSDAKFLSEILDLCNLQLKNSHTQVVPNTLKNFSSN